MRRAIPTRHYQGWQAQPEAQAGFSLPSALFLVLVLSTLGFYAVSLSATSSVTTTRSVQSDQAYFAAVSGFEWAVQDIFQNAGSSLNCAPGAVTLPLTGPASEFTVRVRCNVDAVAEGAATVQVFRIESTAETGAAGDVGFVRRTLVATVAL